MKRVLVCLTALLFFVSLAQADPRSSIKVGAIFILSGVGAEWGTNARRGTMLAVEEINSKGGIQGRRLEVVYEDEPGGSAVGAVQAYQKLVRIDKVKYLFGPNWQDEMMAVAPLAMRDKVIMVSATYMPNPPENVFLVWMDAEIETDKIVEFIFPNYNRVAVLSSQQSWESLVAARFKKTFQRKGGVISSFFEPSPDATDVKSEVLRTKAASPEAVFISSYELFPKYSKGLRQLGVNAPIFGLEIDQTVVDTSGEAAEKTIFIRPAQAGDSFRGRYKARFGGEPDIPAIQSYDAVYVLARALKTVGESYSRLVDYFKKFPAYRGASGTFELEQGRTVVDTELVTVRNGKIEKLQQYKSPSR